MFASIAEFARALIQQRVSTGRDAARNRGVRFGRPAKLTPEQIELGQRLIAEGKSAREVAKMFEVHAATLYRAISSPTAPDNGAPGTA